MALAIPLPTQPEADLLDLFAQIGLTQQDADLISQAPWYLTNVKTFANNFDDREAFRPQLFDKIHQWRGEEGKVARLKEAVDLAVTLEANPNQRKMQARITEQLPNYGVIL